jgi:hypothetical protein
MDEPKNNFHGCLLQTCLKGFKSHYRGVQMSKSNGKNDNKKSGNLTYWELTNGFIVI